MSDPAPATADTLPPAPAPAVKAKPATDWWGELKGVFWLILAVLAFHSFLAKPFYIPSESMMPTLIKGDRLVVTKYPYGWSYVSPSFHVLSFIPGRIFGRLPERGDVVIITPQGKSEDYIKRVVGLPGDTIEVRGGQLVLNGTPVRRVRMPDAMIPVDANVPCDSPAVEDRRVMGADGKLVCRLPIYRETLPGGRTYDTIDLRYEPTVDDYGPITVPARHVFVMGDNRDQSADSRVSESQNGLGGPVPWENLGGRAEFHHLLARRHVHALEPAQLVHRDARRTRRHQPASRAYRTVTDAPSRPAEAPGPSDFSDPQTAREVKRAAVWIGMAAAVWLVWMLAQPILLIIGGLVFAMILDGGTRLLGRVLPIGRGWRLLIVALAGVAFIVFVFFYAGTSIGGQFEALRATVTAQVGRLLGWAQHIGLIGDQNQLRQIGGQIMGSIGKLTSFVGNALGAVSSLAMILVLGIFIAVEPRLYERGIAWMLPLARREHFYETSRRIGHTLRLLMAGRLLGMGIEGIGTWLLLWVGGVPMAGLLGILTGLLAFLPNIGAIVSGVLIVLVGFSQGVNTGLWAVAVYLIVQTIDGYLIVPMVAKRSVDLAPALVLGAQLLFGTLFGILGLALADPMVAMLKVLLESRSTNAAEDAGVAAPVQPG